MLSSRHVGLVLVCSTIVLAGCSGDRGVLGAQTSGSGAGTAATGYRLPDDLCDQFDYDIASEVLGTPHPPYPPDPRSSPAVGENGATCQWLFLGIDNGRLPGGAVTIELDILETAAAAIGEFDKNAVFLEASPFPRATELSADQVRFRLSQGAATVDLRYGDLVIEVDVRVLSGWLSDLGPLAERVPAIAATLALQVQDVLESSDVLDGSQAGDRSAGSG